MTQPRTRLTSGDTLSVSSRLGELGAIHQNNPSMHAGYVSLIQALGEQENVPDEIRVRLRYVARLQSLCDFDGAFNQANRALEIAIASAVPAASEQVMALSALAFTRLHAGHVTDAMYFLMQAESLGGVDIAKEAQRTLQVALGAYYAQLGDFDRALVCQRLSFDLSETHYERANSLLSLGYSYLRAGEEVAASDVRREYLEQAQAKNLMAAELTLEHGLPLLRGRALGNMASAHRLLGQMDEARRLLAQARPIAVEVGDTWQMAENEFFQAQEFVADRNLEAADSRFEIAFKAAETNYDIPLMVRCLNEWSLLKEKLGDIGAALSMHRRFHRMSNDMHSRRESSRAQLSRFRIDIERSKHEDTASQFTSAQLKEQNAQLSAQAVVLGRYANTDSLTGIANRRRLFSEMRARLAAGEIVDVLFVDVDNFKCVNDRFGHHVGDEVLTRIAALVQTALPPSGLVARLGGEEFVVVAPASATNPLRSIPAWAHVVHSSIGNYSWRFEDSDQYITVSAGFTTSLVSDTADTLLARADSGMYAAKKAGKNRILSA